jgi:tubby and related proteins
MFTDPKVFQDSKIDLRSHFNRLTKLSGQKSGIALSNPRPVSAAGTASLLKSNDDSNDVEIKPESEPPKSKLSAGDQLLELGLSTVYDPSPVIKARVSLEESFQLWKTKNPRADQDDFWTSRCSRDSPIIECRLTRKDGLFGSASLLPVYTLTSENSLSSLTSKKKNRNRTSNYPIFTSSGTKLGKLRSNFVGSQFHLYSRGRNPTKSPGASPTELRTDIMVVDYKSSSYKREPRTMRVTVLEGQDIPLKLINKQPIWNEELKAFVLNFNKRAKQPSVKNFQLVLEENLDEVVLQLGKVSNEEFNLDFKYPFSPWEALAVALTSFDFKLCCE